MRPLKKLFRGIIAIILVPTFVLIGAILYSQVTGNRFLLPFNVSDASTFSNLSIQTEDVYDATGSEIIGERGFAFLSKEALSAMTPSEYYSFYETTLKDSTYLWFSLICEDGSGLFVPDCSDGSACFCSLDEMGRRETAFGYLYIEGDSCVYREVTN